MARLEQRPNANKLFQQSFKYSARVHPLMSRPHVYTYGE